MKRGGIFAPQSPAEPDLASLKLGDDPAIARALEALHSATLVKTRAEAHADTVGRAASVPDDSAERRRARLEQPAALRELAEAEVVVAQANEALSQAVDAARARMRPAILAAYEQAVAELDNRLEHAAEANQRVAHVLVRAGELLGHAHGLETLVWPELASETCFPPISSKLACWRRFARKAGLAVREP